MNPQTHCARCGARPAAALPSTPTINTAERIATKNGWSLGEFRFAQLQLASARPAAAETIPAAPDQHARIRAANGVTGHGTVNPPARARVAAAADTIPPAPDQHERLRAIRAAAGAR